MKDFFGAHHGLDERSMESLVGALENTVCPPWIDRDAGQETTPRLTNGPQPNCTEDNAWRLLCDFVPVG